MSWFTGTKVAAAGLAATVVGVVTVIASMALTGVVAPHAFVPPAAADALPAFDDCTSLQQWYRNAALPLVTAYGMAGAYGGDVMARGGDAVMAAGAGLAPKAESSATGAVGNGPTGTNVQEAGVDEADVVKTDGRHVVGVSGDRLWVADATGNTPRVIGRLELNGYASQLLLDGDRALLLGGGFAGVEPMADVAPSPYQATRLTLVDLSEPAAPRVVATEDVDGWVVSARLSAGIARVVVSSTPRLRFEPPAPPAAQPLTPAVEKAFEAAAVRRNTMTVSRASAQDWLPRRTVRSASGAVVTSGPLLRCTDVRHPEKPSGVQTLSVLTIDPQSQTPFTGATTSAVTASGNLVYASPSTLYVATSQWGTWRPATKAEEVTTQIHAFDIRGTRPATYVGSGEVPGYLLSQWAMSEQDGYLRVAVTTGTPTPPAGEGVAPSAAQRSQTSVVVLTPRGGHLVEVGRVDGLGRGERVWAVRWFGDLAAVVTFRQTDPLYLVDLSQPTAPRLRGALELTGYSAYLHPVGDGLLLGVGHEADAAGHILQAQVSLFDVRDPAHPRRLDRRLLGAGWTAVENDSHAFTYLPGHRLAVLPFSGYGETVVSGGPGDGAAGVMPVRPSSRAVGVTVDGGRLGDGGQLITSDYGQVQRVLPVGDRLVAWTGESLVTASPDGLRVLGSTRIG